MSRQHFTTPALERSRERKHRNRAKHEEMISAQAALLGISVRELVHRQTLQAEEVRAKSKKNVVDVHVTSGLPPDFDEVLSPLAPFNMG